MKSTQIENHSLITCQMLYNSKSSLISTSTEKKIELFLQLKTELDMKNIMKQAMSGIIKNSI